jgi:hypothetical protein
VVCDADDDALLQGNQDIGRPVDATTPVACRERSCISVSERDNEVSKLYDLWIFLRLTFGWYQMTVPFRYYTCKRDENNDIILANIV